MKQITITKDAGSKIMALLRSCLQSLAVLLEIQLPQQITDSIKLIEELLTYLAAFINFVPTTSIECIRHLLKYMFAMNFMCRSGQYEILIKNQFLKNGGEGENKVFGFIKEFNKFKPGSSAMLATSMKPADSVSPSSPSTPLKLVGIGSPGPNTIETKRTEGSSNIKLFEPIVIQCLKVIAFISIFI